MTCVQTGFNPSNLHRRAAGEERTRANAPPETGGAADRPVDLSAPETRRRGGSATWFWDLALNAVDSLR